ncbi:YdeI/OmpD-associated family protein [Gracilibacillus salinarum]|uniref:YdeI/OmpD-associated family protein n=1 Tax=Gracilibacillus salinarum TaxID=2932255 RepID=A0ABY4GKF9_9BACI|nr:YdeI/OmpD-associated family protein [Gracilibacillus salinarum]UOQ84851.1 YdeI/OmpD-associated family protein [Gracilibacillus salinarum]
MSIIIKLNLSKYKNLVVLNQPNDYDLFNQYKKDLSDQHDAIFIFVETIEEMMTSVKQIIQQQSLDDKGYLYFAYPKKGNKRYQTYVHRDQIFPALRVGEDGYIEGSDLKFSRMVSMDEVFTVVGIKREPKKVKKTRAASQKVEDYQGNIKDVEQFLAGYPEQLDFYLHLTPGYQRDWARYIYSAKQQKTKEKRQQQMIDILKQGYKSMELFRQSKK